MPKRKQIRAEGRGTSDDTDDSSNESGSPSDRPDGKRVRWQGKGGLTLQDEYSEASSDEEVSEPSEKTQQTCLAALCSHGSLGCAYYDPNTRVLSLLEDTQDTLHFDLTQMLLEQVNADVVLTSTRSDDEFIDALNGHMEGKDSLFQIRPCKDFAASKGKSRLLSLSRFATLASDDHVLPPSSDTGSDSSRDRPHNAYDFMRSRREVTGDPTAKRWNASVRLSNFASVDSAPLCMASVGALLDHIVRERASTDFDDDGVGSLDICDIEILSLDQVMQINADALLSLQVFENESHASVHSDKTKEGLSLFGILNNTKTTLGRTLLRTWLLRPSLSLQVIRDRLDAVGCFVRPENLSSASLLRTHLKGLKNIPRIMGLMRTGKSKLVDWQGLVKFTYHATMLRDSLSELHEASGIDVVKKLIRALDTATFKELGSRINEIIDWEESSTNERVCVRPHIDEDLDNRKHVYHGIDSILSTVAEQIADTVPPDFAASLNVVYFPQLGYLICVPMLEEWRSEAGIQPIEGWSFQFSSEYIPVSS
ncbi:unnamed protein product [Cyclocybe aegerita]|uniref:DNA mismatch repair protein MutS core domain-containing protein n=1 Tax=Cyclocybe aegerita TaxID=1973307 RepID=A0A8S0XDM7_CYCAE|nr:unnamed protein product [Cyclocybe aegerita]